MLTLSAHDQGSPPRSSSLPLLVQVQLPFLKSVHFSLATAMGFSKSYTFTESLCPLVGLP